MFETQAKQGIIRRRFLHEVNNSNIEIILQHNQGK
jgi:hypothetical protein